jgi:hypothetical protein
MKAKLRSLLAIFPAMSLAVALTGCYTPAPKSASATPCLDVLPLFTDANGPEMGPDETPSPADSSTNGITPPNLPGKGLAQHPMLMVGENNDRMFLVNNGKVIWTYSTGKSYEYDDVWMLSNGNILFSRMEYVAEITPDKKVVWRYDCSVPGGTNHTEIHTCQPIGLDKVMIVVNGLPPMLKIINIRTGTIEVDHELPFTQPPNSNGIHGQFRRTHVIAQGTYLVPVLGLGYVVEYDNNFNEIWRYKINSPWSALRLKNGNTLITDEKDSLTREVNVKDDTVWEFNTKKDLPAEYQFASAPQTATRLQDWKDFDGVTAAQILDDPGIPEIPGQSEH